MPCHVCPVSCPVPCPVPCPVICPRKILKLYVYIKMLWIIRTESHAMQREGQWQFSGSSGKYARPCSASSVPVLCQFCACSVPVLLVLLLVCQFCSCLFWQFRTAVQGSSGQFSAVQGSSRQFKEARRIFSLGNETRAMNLDGKTIIRGS